MADAALASYDSYWSEARAMKEYFNLIKTVAEERGMNDLAYAISDQSS